MYSERFSEALKAAQENDRSSIGTYMERTQHRVLKFFFEPDASFHEVPVRAYIADICNGDQIYEIQTSGFGNLNPKLEDFLTDHRVCVIYPIATVKTVMWSDTATGDVTVGKKQRRSFVKFKLLSELIHIYKYIGCNNLSIIAVETEVHDLRLLDGRGAEKKIKATKVDRVPVNILSLTDIRTIEDVKTFAQLNDGAIYSRADLQKKFQLKGRNFSAAVKTLILLGILKEHHREKRNVYYITCEKGDNCSDQSL